MPAGRTQEVALAARFRALHAGPRVLVLVNAWDAASAGAFARLPACAAIATTSGGVAASLGYADGEAMSRAEMLAAVAGIVRAVDLPVTADVEGGYGPTTEDAAETAAGVIAAGAVGMNLEDTARDGDQGPLLPVGLQAERLAVVRETAEREGVPLVLNARIDTYVREVGEPEERFEETLVRARAYLAAGADCVFPIMLSDAETIRRLCAELGAPVNVMLRPDTPSVAELERLGVRRISVGSALQRLAIARAVEAAEELLAARDA